MFAYCNNSPTGNVDDSGTLVMSTALVAGAIVVGASAIFGFASNAISVASNGGSTNEWLMAGLIGAAGGAVGGLITVVAGYSPAGGAIGRGVATLITDLGTNKLLNGEITGTDIALAAFDATSDMMFSTISGFYLDGALSSIVNDISRKAISAIATSAIDIGVDAAQNELFNQNSRTNRGANNRNTVTRSTTTTAQRRTTSTRASTSRNYAHRKVGMLLGII